MPAWPSPTSHLETSPIRLDETRTLAWERCVFAIIRSTESVLFYQATLCSMKGCMRAMVAQLKSDSEDLQQVNSPVTVLHIEVLEEDCSQRSS